MLQRGKTVKEFKVESGVRQRHFILLLPGTFFTLPRPEGVEGSIYRLSLNTVITLGAYICLLSHLENVARSAVASNLMSLDLLTAPDPL